MKGKKEECLLEIIRIICEIQNGKNGWEVDTNIKGYGAFSVVYHKPNSPIRYDIYYYYNGEIRIMIEEFNEEKQEYSTIKLLDSKHGFGEM